MPTVQQLVRKGRKKKVKHSRGSKCNALDGRPQLSGIVLRVFIRLPRKPNSAQRKCAKVKLSNGKTVVAFIGGENHNLSEHHRVLVRGGRVRDLPGVRYHIVRGVRDCLPPDGRSGDQYPEKKRQARSKYGQKRADLPSGKRRI